MSRASPGDLAQEISRHNRVDVGSADTEAVLRRNPAGPHVADAAADTAFTEPALVSLVVHPEKAQVYIVLLSLTYSHNRGQVNCTVLRFFTFFIHLNTPVRVVCHSGTETENL